MARQEVDIGIEGNDGTGDSIRESFKKVNTNFTELYAVFGLGGAISFKNIDDVPDSYLGNTTAIPAVNSTETGLNFYKFVSDTGNNGAVKAVNTINNSVVVEFEDVDPSTPNQSGTVKIIINDPHIERDPDPTLNAPLNAQAVAAYSNAINAKLRNTGAGDDINTLVTDWTTTHPGSAAITTDNIVVSKGFADDTYVNVAGDTMTGALSVPAGASGAQVPRTEEVITRAGSETNRRMLDTLYLSDHPNPLEGFGTPNGKDDLQAVTKLYVDTQGYASATNIYVSTAGDDAQKATPSGQEGRSPQYAYKTINAAMIKAEEIIEATPFEPGPYVQQVTYDDGTVNSIIDSVTGYSSPSTAVAASGLAVSKTNEIQEFVQSYIAVNYTDLTYDIQICKRDVKLMIDSVRLDVNAGLTVNYLSRWAGLRYNANPSAIKAQVDQGEATRASIAVVRAQLVSAFNDANTATPGTISAGVITAYTDRFNEIIDILSGTDVALAATGAGYTLAFTNGTNAAVDQGGEGNPDLIEGKIIVGKLSGAKGIITDYTRSASVTTDSVLVDLVEPIEFIPGEGLEYGNRTRNNQITVRIESGIYQEHLPIKLPENVSIKGDEFRRVVLRPKPGVSQSKWNHTYFYRDIVTDDLISAYSPAATITNVSAADASRTLGTYQIDADDWGSNGAGVKATFQVIVLSGGSCTVSITGGGDGFIIGETITINDSKIGNGGGADLTFDIATTGGGYHFTHPVSGKQGKYGYHYVSDPSKIADVGTDATANLGNFNNASRLIELNKAYLVEETIEFVDTNYPVLVYNETKCRRDTGLIVDGIVKDLRVGGRENTLTNQGAYYSGSVDGQEAETEAAITNLKAIITNILANDSGNPYAGTGSVTQIFDADYTAESESNTQASALVDCVAYFNNVNYNPPLNNSEMDVLLCNDGTIVRNITVQRQGGFMMVLDPEGQILTRSPYCQTGSSFAQSKGTNRNFAGGLFVDGYAGNMPATIDTVNNPFSINVSSPTDQGLFVRRPPTPFPFFIDGSRYQVNTISAYDKATGTATFILDETSNPSDSTSRDIDNISQATTAVMRTTTAHPYSDADRVTISNVNGMIQINSATLYVKTTLNPNEVELYTDVGLTAGYNTSAFSAYTGSGLAQTFVVGRGYIGSTGVDMFVQSGGNRSMLANDFTQINDLGFGALCVNNALAELVSMFTYYCHTGYLALDGSQIRSLGGNNSYGIYGLVSAGADPDEVATDVSLASNMVFPGKTFRSDTILDFSAAVPTSGNISAGQTLTQGLINATITAVTQASPASVTATGHGLTNADLVTIAGVVGMTELNGLQFYVSVIDANTFTLYTDAGLSSAYDSSTNTAYTSGGTATRAANATGILSFTGEEDGSGNPTRLYVHSTTGTFNTTATITSTTSTNVGIPATVTSQDNDAPEDSLFMYVYDLKEYPHNVSEVEILHDTGLYQPYEITNASDSGYILGSYDIDTSSAAGLTGTYTANTAIFKVKKTRSNNYSVDITGGGSGAGAAGETIIIPGTLLGGATPANDATITTTDVNSGVIGTVSIAGTPRFDDSTPVHDGQVWKLNFGTGLEGTASNGLQENTDHDTKLVIRHKQNFLLDDFGTEELPTRPSTAFTFVNDTTEYVYRTILFGNQITDGVTTGANQRMVTFDANFRYTDLSVDQDIITVTESFFDANSTVDSNYTDIVLAATPSATVTMGATAATTSADGSRFIVIGQLDETERTRLANADMIFTWGGKTYQIDAYSEYAYTGGSGTSQVAVVRISDVANTDVHWPLLNAGLAKTLVNGGGITLKAGLASDEDAEITVNISTNRATGHDMLDIGTGGFNTSNYPERIYGSPFGFAPVSAGDAIDSTGNASAAQVQERNKGRVFATLTDQDGFFRVGRFFTVDQGTGSVTFNAALVLTNIDGIGFKRGVRVNEFSNDDTFTDAKGDAVPTQTATEGYIDQRLGFDRDGATGGNVIGPGVMSLGGPGFDDTPMNSDMNLGSNRVTNLGTPTASSDAVTKQYVDQKTDELNDIGDVTITGTGATITSNILAFVGTNQQSVNVEVTGDIGLTYTSGNTIVASIATGVIVNNDINASAAIAQSKLDMNAATTRANATGIAQADLGLVSVNSAEFDATDGWIELSTGGIANNKLTNSSVTIGSTSIALGATSTSLAGLTGLAFSSGTISGTVGIDITGSITHTGNIVGPANSGADNGVSIGSSTNRYNTIWATTFNGEATAALYADLAENYLGDADYEPGTVLVFGGDEEVTECTAKGQTSAAGVVTTNPAHLMNSALQGDHVVGLALQGRVPCKVIGKVSKGDMLVTSAVPGYAIVNNTPGVGQVIGKAVGTKDDSERGIVEVVVGRV